MIFAGKKTPEPLIKIPLQFFRDEGAAGHAVKTPDIPEFAKSRNSPGSIFKARFLTTAAGGKQMSE